jgi:hypothetical protein
MKKFALLLVSATILMIVSPAVAQYGPWPPGVWGYPVPFPGYMRRGYRWPESRGYRWREWWLYEDWRRGYIVDDKQVRENYETPPILYNPTARGAITDPGECAIGFSEETCRRRGQKYSPPR